MSCKLKMQGSVTHDDYYSCISAYNSAENRCLFSQRRQGRQELQCFFCAYPKCFCVLCASARSNDCFSRRGAESAENFNVLLLAQTPLRALRLGEILYVFLSQRLQGSQELQCFFCAYPQYLCVLCASARFNDYFSRRGAESAENLNVLLLAQTPLRALRLGESKYRWVSPGLNQIISC